jgi:hypothetical protein
MKNAKIKQILKQARKAIDNPETSEFNWMYPQEFIEPSEQLIRVQMQICIDTSQEMYLMIDFKKKDYTSDDAEKIVSEIDFGKSLSSEEKQLLVDAVKKNIQAFSRHKADIGYTTLVEHEIDLINNTPIKLKPYKLSFAEQKAAAEFVQQLLKEGQVTLNKSPWSTPAFFVPKPDGSLRLFLVDKVLVYATTLHV